MGLDRRFSCFNGFFRLYQYSKAHLLSAMRFFRYDQTIDNGEVPDEAFFEQVYGSRADMAVHANYASAAANY